MYLPIAMLTQEPPTSAQESEEVMKLYTFMDYNI